MPTLIEPNETDHFNPSSSNRDESLGRHLLFHLFIELWIYFLCPFKLLGLHKNNFQGKAVRDKTSHGLLKRTLYCKAKLSKVGQGFARKCRHIRV